MYTSKAEKSVFLVLYDASYHSGGRVEAFFSFQANKLSQNNNICRLTPLKMAARAKENSLL